MTLRRTGLKPGKTPLKRGGPLRPMSAKRLAALGGWARSTFAPSRPRPAVTPSRRKTLAERSGGWCEARLDVCGGRATDPHHRITRKDGGRSGEARVRLDELSDLLHLCRRCHGWVHLFPARAREQGLSLKEHQIPAHEPVRYRGDLMYLTDSGDVVSFEQAGA
jgi:hypothetical protein